MSWPKSHVHRRHGSAANFMHSPEQRIGWLRRMKILCVHWPSIPNHLFHSLRRHIPFTVANRSQNFRMNQNNGQSAQGLLLHAAQHPLIRTIAETIFSIRVVLVTFTPFIVRFRAIVCWCFPLCTSFSIVFSRSWCVRVRMMCLPPYTTSIGRGKMHFSPKEMTEALTCWIRFRRCLISVVVVFYCVRPHAHSPSNSGPPT